MDTSLAEAETGEEHILYKTGAPGAYVGKDAKYIDFYDRMNKIPLDKMAYYGAMEILDEEADLSAWRNS